jgi:aminoglycoside phosphotransferase (APT) family kinase protein
MPISPFSLDALRAVIIERFPEHAGGQFSLLAEGWDSVAVDVDDQLIFKFPRHPRGEAALRREVAILAVVGGAVSMPVPSLTLFEMPQTFSRHAKIPGDHLVTAQYNDLPELSRQQLGEAMGRFYAELHAIDPARALAAGAEPVETWLRAEAILRLVWPVLPEPLRAFAQATTERWAALPADPHGQTYGFFDGHGWNMAFNHTERRLNGVYDFADSGIGPLHQEFIYSSLISADLTERIIATYESHTGRAIDRERVDLLTATHRLWELAVQAHLPDHIAGLLAALWAWADRR